MFDHVTIRVRDRARSERFFATILNELGIETTSSTDRFAMWQDFILTEADAEHPTTTGLHIAFVAASRQQVDRFWRVGVDSGHSDAGPPGPRPRYREDYYGAFLLDASGNSIEAVHHGAPRENDGVIDHLWIRVADLTSATGFYRMVAPAAGFGMREEGSERSTFARPGSGGSFSLVPGAPTANLHMAFPGSDDAVRRFYDDAIAAGYRSNGEPGERPRYHPGYYAAFILDPDGNNIEVVNHHRA
jgi:catechol 2,3-dioxygenase-like lactoylglutathione lyase family enzyme